MEWLTQVDVIEIQNLLEKNAKVIQTLTEKINYLQPKAEFYDAVAKSDDWMEMSAVAKILNFEGYGRNKIFTVLRDEGVLRSNNEPYQQYVDRGYFKIIEQQYSTGYDEVRINRKTVVSQKGLDFIRKTLKEAI